MKKYFVTYCLIYIVGFILSFNSLIFDVIIATFDQGLWESYVPELDGTINDFHYISDYIANTIAMPIDTYLYTIEDNLILFVTCDEYDIYYTHLDEFMYLFNNDCYYYMYFDYFDMLWWFRFIMMLRLYVPFYYRW